MKPKTVELYQAWQQITVNLELYSQKYHLSRMIRHKNILAKQKLIQFTINRLLAKELLKDEHLKEENDPKRMRWNRRNTELNCSGKEDFEAREERMTRKLLEKKHFVGGKRNV